VITGSVAVIGSAGGAGFVGYVLDYAVGDQPSETDWQMVALPGSAPVSDGTLAVWQTDTLASGIYALRLRVLDSSGNVRASQVRVIVAR
jgi:hypothetical protein